MTRFFLTEDGKVARDNPAELPVAEDMPPQILRFNYGGVWRIAQVITLRPDAGGYHLLFVALELWNSRDGVHDEGAVKTFHVSRMIGVTAQ